jgi:hypothetical protein
VLVDEDAPTNRVPGARASLVMHTAVVHTETSEAGGYSFGRIPKSWPLDANLTASYYVVFLKDGWTSCCARRTPSAINRDVLDAVYALRRTNATITLSGVVRSSESGWPVGDATVRFGPLTTLADTNGLFVFSNLPPALATVPSAPTHVLIATADGYRPTRNVYTTTGGGGTVDVFIDGGETYLSGRVLDAASGAPLSNGAVSTPELPVAAPGAPLYSIFSPYAQTVGLSRSGFFTIRVPGGCPHVTISCGGATQEIPVSRAITGNQPVRNDIFFLPEPSPIFVLALLAVTRLLRSAQRQL